MTRDVCVCSPAESICDCAKAMARNDIGALPVAENNRLIGMVTDRDIVIRGVACGKGPDTAVREVLSQEVLYCYEDQELEHVAKSMGLARIRRVPVLARDHSLTGMLSLADIASRNAEIMTSALAALSRHGGPHSQSRPAADKARPAP